MAVEYPLTEADVSQPILSLNKVNKTYPGGDKPALDRVSISVMPREFFSILGPSGSGKTTILRMIAGFEQPDRGNVVLDGRDVTGVPPFRRDVRTVFQSYALFPHMSVLDNVAYPLKMAGMPKAERIRAANEALDLVSMQDFPARLPHQLSGGQRQRIALARAIVGRPKLLLLDEPLGALDLRLRQQMQHTLTVLQREIGIAFVYVTHDQGEALSMSDRVAVMRDGRIAQLGAPQELYFRPQSEFVAQFVGRSNLLSASIGREGDEYIARIDGLAQPVRGIPARSQGAAKIAVRFESVQLQPLRTQEDCSRGFPGVVEDVLFMGSSLEVAVRCGDLRLIASIASGSGLVRGQDVAVQFDLQTCAVFHG